jgi:hypothetical protein
MYRLPDTVLYPTATKYWYPAGPCGHEAFGRQDALGSALVLKCGTLFQVFSPQTPTSIAAFGKLECHVKHECWHAIVTYGIEANKLNLLLCNRPNKY